MSVDKTPRKPLIFAENPFDTERMDDVENRDANWDASYVPGYSEAKAHNETLAGKGKKAVPIPRLQWIRISNTAGRDLAATNDLQLLNYLKLGYCAMGLADLERYNYKMPPTSTVTAEGLIRRGDQALFFIDEQRAERNRNRQYKNSGTQKGPKSDNPAIYESEREDVTGTLSELAALENKPLFDEGKR